MILLASAMQLSAAGGRRSAASRPIAALILTLAVTELSAYLFQVFETLDQTQFRLTSLPTIVALIDIATVHLFFFQNPSGQRVSGAVRPLRQWLASYALLIAVPLVFAAGLALVRLSEADARATDIDLERQSDLVAVIVEQYLEDKGSLAARLARFSVKGIDDPDRFGEWVQPIAGELASGDALLMTSNGRILSTLVPESATRLSGLSSRRERLQAARTRAVSFGDVSELGVSGSAMFFAYAPVMNGDDVAGIVAIGIPASDLSSMLTTLGLRSDRMAVVFDSEGNVVAGSREDPAAAVKLIRIGLEDSRPGSARGSYAFTDQNGQSVSGFYVKLPGTNWSSTLSMTHSTRISLPVYFTILLALAALILAITTAFVLGGRLSRSASALVASAAKIGTVEVSALRPTGILELDAVADSMSRSDRLLSRQSRDLVLSEARYRSLVEDQSELICRFTGEGRIVFANRAFARVVGDPASEIQDRSIFAMLPASDIGLLRATISRLDADSPAATFDAHVIDRSGELRSIEWSVRLVGVDSSEIKKYQAIGRDITERQSMLRALQASKDRMQLAFRAARACAWEWNAASDSTTWSAECKDLLGCEPNGPADGFVEPLAFTKVAEPDRVQAALANAKSSGGLFNIEFKACRADGTDVWLGVIGQVVLDASFAPVSASGILQDVTERRQKEAYIDQLIQEVSHRAKNMLAVVQAVARQTASTQASEFMPRLVERLNSLAASLDLLVHSAWKGINLIDLVKAQLAHIPASVGHQVEITGPELRLSSAAGQTIGMAVHELATNARKYGALRNEAAGRVEVNWAVERTSVEPRFAMSWVEHAAQGIALPMHRGFGTTVVVEMVKLGLSAEVHLDYRSGGMSWHMTCALSAVTGLQPERSASSERSQLQ